MNKQKLVAVFSQITNNMLLIEDSFHDLGLSGLSLTERHVLACIFDLSIRFSTANKMHLLIHPTLVNVPDYDINMALNSLLEQHLIAQKKCNEYEPVWKEPHLPFKMDEDIRLIPDAANS